MNTDFRLSVFFLDHPKTVKLKRRLGPEGFESLIRLWTWAALNRPDGDIGTDPDDVEIAARWNGEPGAFVSVLESLKWVDLNDGRYLLHDWQEHNPWAADAEDRGDEARLSRLFRTNAEKAKEIKAQGRTGITKEEYQEFKKPIPKYDRSTTVVRPNNDRTAECSTPAPAPAPAPAHKNTYNQRVSVTTVAREEPENHTHTLEGGRVESVSKPQPPPVVATGHHGISEGWEPKLGTVQAMEGMGIPAEFAKSCIPHFRLHHAEAGTQRQGGFESLFVGWVKGDWTREQGKPKPMAAEGVPLLPNGRPNWRDRQQAKMTLAEWSQYQSERYFLLHPDPEPEQRPLLGVTHAH